MLHKQVKKQRKGHSFNQICKIINQTVAELTSFKKLVGFLVFSFQKGPECKRLN